MPIRSLLLLPAVVLISALTPHTCRIDSPAQWSIAAVKSNPLRDAYYGDLHLHTSYSLDAYLNGTIDVDPQRAYRFAKGDVVDYLGQRAQRSEPLDFMAVTDHAEFLGINGELESSSSTVVDGIGSALKAAVREATDPDGIVNQTRLLPLHDNSANHALTDLLNTLVRGIYGVATDHESIPDSFKARARSDWQREIDAANDNYEPGRFTTFIAYEWTSTPNVDNLHRNVIFRGDSAPYPFTALDSNRPEDLWGWLEKIKKEGYEALAIPHNGNASNGLMYDWVNSDGKPIDSAYAERRQANEPLTEISQTKGSSETHPLLSPADEFADYEIFDFLQSQREGKQSKVSGSYVREALGRGLVLQSSIDANPYKYGFVGGSDWHSGLSVSAQADSLGLFFRANLGGGRASGPQAVDILAGNKRFGPVTPLQVTSGNLTGVWAESNTRESIYAALRRRETFATTGTRMKFRFFGSWGFKLALRQDRHWVAEAYRTGVPMGSDLPAAPAIAAAPTFAVWAVKDPHGANLDRAQIVKVWEEGGQQREKVFDVAWSGPRRCNSKTGKLPPVGDTVDLKTGRYRNEIGAEELEAVWKDSEFKPRQAALYYLRVLEIPTPRWSTLLAIQAGLPLPKGVPATIQQRGWSSPIWVGAHAAQ